jgi:hypothetical protein
MPELVGVDDPADRGDLIAGDLERAHADELLLAVEARPRRRRRG